VLSVSAGEISVATKSLSFQDRTQDILGKDTSCLNVIGIGSYKRNSVHADIPKIKLTRKN
jgi:hypothetical protein